MASLSLIMNLIKETASLPPLHVMFTEFNQYTILTTTVYSFHSSKLFNTSYKTITEDE